MLRTLAILLLSLLFALGGEASARVTGLAEGGAAQPAKADCCPDAPVESDEEGDCCDVDFGRCCATGVAALVPSAGAGHGWRPASSLDHAPIVPRRLLPQPTGPPPTPPPIA